MNPDHAIAEITLSNIDEIRGHIRAAVVRRCADLLVGSPDLVERTKKLADDIDAARARQIELVDLLAQLPPR